MIGEDNRQKREKGYMCRGRDWKADAPGSCGSPQGSLFPELLYFAH